MTRWFAIPMLTVALSAWGGGSAVELARAGVKEFTAAYQVWDGARFARAADLFRQATTNDSQSALYCYWLGVAHFHRMLQIQNQAPPATNAATASEALDAAAAALKRAIKLSPDHAESHALLGTLYGMKIDGNLVRAAWYGPRIEKHGRSALKFGSHNPRVHYLLGTGQFHTASSAAAYREVLATLLEAEKLYLGETAKPAQPLEPRWGHASCLTFIGRTYERLGQRKEAADYFGKALAIQPSDHLARQGLARVTTNK